MNIKVMRNIHMYLGAFFTPLLMIFTISGVLQTFELHEKEKGSSYNPPQIVQYLAQIHQHQRLSISRQGPAPSKPFKILVLVMSIALLVTLILGVLLAFKFSKPWIVWILILLGAIVPLIPLYLAFK